MTSKTSVKPADRLSALKARQSLKMARSAHAYVRGSTAKFYQWLEEQKRGTLPEGPAVWICGDCHVGNLGPVAAADGRVAIQIRDFDQTVIGNPAHDIIRLALSLATASRGSDLPGVVTAHILEQVIEGYQAVLSAEALGLGVVAFVRVTLATHSPDNAKRFRALVNRVDAIQEAYSLTGDADYLLKAVLRDLKSLSNIVNNVLMPHQSVAHVRSSIVLDRLKESAKLPLKTPG